MGSLSQPRLNIFTVGNMRVMICLGQGGLRSLSASSYESLKSTCSFGEGGEGTERRRGGKKGEEVKRDQPVILSLIFEKKKFLRFFWFPARVFFLKKKKTTTTRVRVRVRVSEQAALHEKWIFMFFMAAQELNRNPRLDAQPTLHEKWIFMFFMAA